MVDVISCSGNIVSLNNWREKKLGLPPIWRAGENGGVGEAFLRNIVSLSNSRDKKLTFSFPIPPLSPPQPASNTPFVSLIYIVSAKCSFLALLIGQGK